MGKVRPQHPAPIATQGAHKSHIIPIAPTPDARPVLTSRSFLYPKRSAKPFRPWSLVDGDRREPTLRPVFLPYWVFDVTVSVKYRGKVGFDAGEKKEWVEVDTWRDGGTTTYDASAPETQVCASFAHRRDLAAAVTGPHVGKLPWLDGTNDDQNNQNQNQNSSINLVPMPDPTAAALDASRAGAGPPGSVEVERYGMKRSLAWELASRRIRETERSKARRTLLESHQATYAKDVVLEVELHPGRRVRAVRLPCYIARFTHGEVHGVDNKIMDAVHHAFVCGHTGVVVVHDEIVCQNKVRALTTFACSVPGIAAAYAFGPEHYGMIAAQTVGASAVLSTVSGIVARQFPHLSREREEQERVADEESAFAAAMRHGAASESGSTQAAWMDEPVQQRRDDVEWGRWKETDKANWDEQRREEWAASIWQWQKIRRRERVERRRSEAIMRARMEEAERRDEEKEKRWGPGWRTEGPRGRGGGGGSARGRDVKGYYRLLGLHKQTHRATSDEIKSAYRREAMEWHPDKHQGTDAKERAARTFRQLQKAYQVLGNQMEREVYDSQ